jgi:N-acetylglucosaminyl-diphospho-decaprenol L-rhamnosyltransferase
MRALDVPRLSIVIVTYNSRGELDGCLESLIRNRPAVDHEIVVVDNASPDRTASEARARWPAVRVLDAGGNLGFAAANNIGIRQTFGELVLLLNPDTIVPHGALDTLVGVLDRHPEAAAVGPRLVDADGRAELSFGRMISPLAELRQKILVAGHRRWVPGISQYVERATRQERSVDWVSGACLLVRRTDAEGAGLFDERYFMYTEDVDFCAALRACGRVVLFTPDAEITHLRGRSVATARSATGQAYRRSQLAFYAKHHPGWVPFLRMYLRLRGLLP